MSSKHPSADLRCVKPAGTEAHYRGYVPESRQRDEQKTRTDEPGRRSQELQETVARLHDRLLDTAEAVRRSHEQSANAMEHLADLGRSEHRERRRRVAKHSRELAEKEARQIAELKDRGVPGAAVDHNRGRVT